MFESRCGVCCNSCERKEKVNCKGCPNMRRDQGYDPFIKIEKCQKWAKKQ
ncbi:hypothetical protein [Clostridium algidicarnis]|nr:hypothetical protein [Clostridium algidicarnis]MBU3227343.1 hypothetical protein [Clostridium algidicarnis]MBU3250866.1 hypothetical protein [Clostridium algidicarnis]